LAFRRSSEHWFFVARDCLVGGPPHSIQRHRWRIWCSMPSRLLLGDRDEWPFASGRGCGRANRALGGAVRNQPALHPWLAGRSSCSAPQAGSVTSLRAAPPKDGAGTGSVPDYVARSLLGWVSPVAVGRNHIVMQVPEAAAANALPNKPLERTGSAGRSAPCRWAAIMALRPATTYTLERAPCSGC